MKQGSIWEAKEENVSGLGERSALVEMLSTNEEGRTSLMVVRAAETKVGEDVIGALLSKMAKRVSGRCDI